jgi:biuret amidohydrolase
VNIGVARVKAAAIAIDLHRGHLDLSVATMPVRSETDARRIIVANKRLFGWCRSVGIPVAHLVTTYRDAEEIRANPFWRTRAEGSHDTRKNVLRHNLAGMPGCTVIPELIEADRDAVVVVEDCVDTMDPPELHAAALACIRAAFGFVMTSEAVKQLPGLVAG